MMKLCKTSWLLAVSVLACGACNQAETRRTPPLTIPLSPVASVSRIEPSPTPQSETRRLSKPDVYGQQRIRFARGQSSATVKGHLAKGEGADYLVNAREGQMMTVTITPRKQDGDRSNDPGFVIYPPEGSSSGILNDDRYQWSGKLPQTGDYVIAVEAYDASAEYTLKVKME